MRFIQLLILLLTATIVSVNAQEEELPPPLDPAYMGEHSFVLIANDSTFYAYYLSGYEKPHQEQMLYSISAKEPAVVYMVKDAEVVTIRSKEPFNLQRLMRDESFELKFDVYLGHHDRDGLLSHPDQILSMESLQFHRSLTDLKPSSNRQIYEEVELKNGRYFLLHRIETAPSFHHVILLDNRTSCGLDFLTSRRVPEEKELLRKLLFCGTLRPLYFDTAYLKEPPPLEQQNEAAQQEL
jgi:hypothetical protein